MTTTITQIDKSREAFFSAFNEEQKTNYNHALDYIKQLASLSGTNIIAWNILEVFGTGEDNAILTDKSQINKKFFEKVNSIRSRKSTKIAELNKIPELVKALDNQIERVLKEKKRSYQGKINSCLDEVKRLHTKMESNLQQATKFGIELSRMNGDDPSGLLKEEIAETLSQGYWINPVVEDNHLYLNTKSNVVISYINKQAKVDVELDVGQLAVKINLDTFEMWVIPYKKNISSQSRFFHPHVNANGSICWGDALSQVSQWRTELKLGSMLRMLYSLLYNYNSSNPYIDIVRLKNENKNYGRVALHLMHPDKKRKPKPKSNPKPTRSLSECLAEVRIANSNNNNDTFTVVSTQSSSNYEAVPSELPDRQVMDGVIEEISND